MKKLLLLILVALLAVAAGCDRSEYAAHRAERGKPKVAVGDNTLTIRRAPYPNINVLPDGRMRMDDIELPLGGPQREMLQNTFVQLQILRQNTLSDPGTDRSKRSVPITVPAHIHPFPDDLSTQIPEFKDYSEALQNLRAEP